MTRTTAAVPRWAVVVTYVLSLIGLALSIYLTYTHFTGKALTGCSTTGVVNCALVTTSAQSRFLGMPVAVLGLATYLVLTAINSPWGWRAKSEWLHVARFAIVAGSMVFVLWLVYAELIILNHVCEYCTGVHVVTFALLVVLTIVSPAQLGWTRSRAQQGPSLEFVEAAPDSVGFVSRERG